MADETTNNEENNELNDAVENSDAGDLSTEDELHLGQQSQSNTNTVTSTVASGAASQAAQPSVEQTDNEGGGSGEPEEGEEGAGSGTNTDTATSATSDNSALSSTVTSSNEEDANGEAASADETAVGSQAVGGEDADSSNDDTSGTSGVAADAPPTSSSPSSPSSSTGSSNTAENNEAFDTQTNSETFNVDVLDVDDEVKNTEDDFDTETTSQVFDVQVDAVNDAPVVGAGVELQASEDIDKILTYEELIGDAYDIEGDDLTVQNIALSNDAHGSIVDNGDGTVTYTPSADFNGAVEFTYELFDGELSTAVTSSIEVAAINDAPRSSGPIILSDNEDSDVTFSVDSLLATMVDVDTASLQLDSISYSGDNGSLVDNGDGTYTFSPNENFHGDIAIDFALHDGEHVVSEHVNVNFASVNDLPEVGAQPNFSMYEDGSLQITPLELLNGVTDADSDVLSIVQ
ncbi:MAG: cadherin-like domain-containing protein, partial [Sinobacterium sp.]|nr:cadherin-like domain-containing protein [Sinobacterium sp.]